jgi:proline iminopeptidase
MVRKLLRYIIYILCLSLSIFFFLIFYPKTYEVTKFQRQNSGYWDLPTGSRIGYTLIHAQGPKNENPIIFLNGGPGGAITNGIISSLKPLSKDGYDLYLYDQVGGGLSNRLEDVREYTAERHKRDLEEIIKTIGAKKVILFGQSWGAVLATLFIADNAEKVAKLILTSPGPIFPVQERLSTIKPPDSLLLRTPLFTWEDAEERNHHLKSLRSIVVTLNAKCYGYKLASDKEMDNYQTLLSDEISKITVCDTNVVSGLRSSGGNGFYSSVMTMESLNNVKDPRAKLTNSNIPMYLIRGQCDFIKWGFTTEYLQLFPNHKLAIIPNAGHSIAVEQPELLLKTLRNFLNK